MDDEGSEIPANMSLSLHVPIISTSPEPMVTALLGQMVTLSPHCQLNNHYCIGQTQIFSVDFVRPWREDFSATADCSQVQFQFS
jgi:hypothetical protein